MRGCEVPRLAFFAQWKEMNWQFAKQSCWPLCGQTFCWKSSKLAMCIVRARRHLPWIFHVTLHVRQRYSTGRDRQSYYIHPKNIIAFTLCPRFPYQKPSSGVAQSIVQQVAGLRADTTATALPRIEIGFRSKPHVAHARHRLTKGRYPDTIIFLPPTSWNSRFDLSDYISESLYYPFIAANFKSSKSTLPVEHNGNTNESC